ncbi:MAG: DUF2490 domain-containing protein [Candidatus Omnitrophica bacterium]|nr:DUF2490 domain-containing protein [Candidatus Omnitrophota bacterium]
MKAVRLFCFWVGLLFLNTAFAYDNGDFQVWHTEAQEFKLNQQWKVGTEEEIRFADDASDFYYQHYDLGFVYGLNKYVDLGINYRQVYEKNSSGEFREENRPHINAILRYEFAGFKFDDRNRLEYRNLEHKNATFRYRNKFSVKAPWKFTKLQIQPYLADEVFINFNSSGFSRNRFYSGFGMNFTKNIKSEIYYLLQSSKTSDRWIDANVLGTKIKVVF